jgi:uroporphyrinogen decarboxylase
MNPRERVCVVISGGIPDRVPVALHNYVMAIRMASFPLAECLQKGDQLAESQIHAWKEFGHDVIQVENGTTAMAQAMGCEVEYSDHMAPRVIGPVIHSRADIEKLRIPDPNRDHPLSELVESVRILRNELGDEVFIVGRSDQAPLAQAAAIRGYEQFFMDISEDPDLVNLMADKCLEATTRLALALKQAGADSTCIGEFGSDTLSPATYQQFALPRLKKFFQVMRQNEFPAHLHQCGNTKAVLKYMAESGASVLELDTHTDIHSVRKLAGSEVTIHGMVDPANVLTRGTPALVEEKSLEALHILAPGGRFIIGPGCALAPETPVENVHTLLETARKWGNYRGDGALAESP